MRRPLFWVALFLVIIAAVKLETGGSDDTLPPGVISARNPGISGELTVIGQVYKKDDQTIYLRDISVRLPTADDLSKESILYADISRQSISLQDNIICKLDEADSVLLGSRVTLSGSFAPMSPATNPGEFDQAAYYRTLNVGGRLTGAELLHRGRDYWRIREFLYELRLTLKKRLYRALPEDQAGILCALLLGDKDGLEERQEELYRRNGILHILSISSLHVTILGMSLYRLLRRLRIPTGPAAAAGGVLLLLYGSLTGFGVSACRAIGMYLIRMLAEALGRTYDMLTALATVAAVMVLKNPQYLHHSGFLLSFSSVLGIGVLCPALVGDREKKSEKPLWKERLLKSLSRSAGASLSVSLATLPVQLWYYYEVPVYAVFLNLFVLPFVKPLMMLGMAVLLAPGFAPAGMGAGLILKWYEFLCRSFEKLPFCIWNPGRPQLWQIGLYYLLLAGSVALKKGMEQRKCKNRMSAAARKSKRDARRIGTAAQWTGVIFAVIFLGLRPAAENQVVFLDVGQGDCILLRTASGENYLFDCGSVSRSDVGEYVLLPYLKYCGIRRLDAVFVSHPDEDHISGILEMLEMEQSNVEIGCLVLPQIAKELQKEQMSRLLEAAAAAGQKEPVEIRYLAAGDVWQAGRAGFVCLHPQSGVSAENVNVYSECVYVEFWEKGNKDGQIRPAGTVLLTGDVEGAGEEALLKELANRDIHHVDVLKVAHHGSRGATTEELLEQIDPVISVISCGRNNRYGHPHGELLERLEKAGSRILKTPDRGAITLHFKKERIRMETYQ